MIDSTMRVAIQQPALTPAVLRGVFAAVGDVLERGIADGSFVEMNVDEAIAAFIGVISQVSLHHLALGPADPTLHTRMLSAAS